MNSSEWGLDPLPDAFHPVLMYVNSGRWHHRHLAKGRMLGDMLVSADLRALLMECDPEGVHLDPIEFQLEDGSVMEDRYWMLKVPRTHWFRRSRRWRSGGRGCPERSQGGSM